MNSITFSHSRPLFLVFERGDDVLKVLRDFAREEGIRGGRFAGIGAFARAVVAYWNPATREYEKIGIDEQVEVLSLLGDITLEGDDTKLHAHAVLGRRDGSTIGGHLIEATVFPTLEMHLVDYGAPLERRHDEETKLSLIRL